MSASVAETKVYGVAYCAGQGLKNIGGIEIAMMSWRKIAEEL